MSHVTCVTFVIFLRPPCRGSTARAAALLDGDSAQMAHAGILPASPEDCPPRSADIWGGAWLCLPRGEGVVRNGHRASRIVSRSRWLATSPEPPADAARMNAAGGPRAHSRRPRSADLSVRGGGSPGARGEGDGLKAGGGLPLARVMADGGPVVAE